MYNIGAVISLISKTMFYYVLQQFICTTQYKMKY